MSYSESMKHSLYQTAQENPEWFKALCELNNQGRPLSLSCEHEQGKQEMSKNKLTDDKTKAFVHWNSYVVRFNNGVVVGEGSSAAKAWEDAETVAASVVNAVNSVVLSDLNDRPTMQERKALFDLLDSKSS